MKSIIAAGFLLGCAQGAIANSGWSGNDYSATVIDNHVGYEGDNWYIQGGPAIVSADGEDAELELSGKVGASMALSESVGLYGEISFMTGDEDTSYGTKAGVKWVF